MKLSGILDYFTLGGFIIDIKLDYLWQKLSEFSSTDSYSVPCNYQVSREDFFCYYYWIYILPFCLFQV